ncbi:Actin/actin-like protein [Patellaria atrata CBS 101060]|uniref:Actin/actin-like protein n=1 Tax=Patellaria atrata CBS 101060 TaxID=1346257 RepID=A0A9P4S400_9PEZI|nr:Actin/actin-like protein [Patellaria atrata CBS 101060]
MASLMSSLNAPSAAEYAGDEVSAIVLDPGYSTVRAGFAGEDVPKSVVPTYYGGLEPPGGATQVLYGENAIHNPIPHLHIKNPMSQDGIVEDWDAAWKLWEYSLTSRLLGAKPTPAIRNGLNDPVDGDVMDVDMEELDDLEKPLVDNPLLMTEPAWNPVKWREKSLEAAMEEWGTPGFYLQRSGVLAAFSAGKPTALVIDIGASQLSVSPVVDGMILKKSVRKSPLAGNWISQQIRLMFAQSQPPVPLTPHYMVTSKVPVDAGAPSNATYKKYEIPPTDSFRRLEEERVLTEFKESVVTTWYHEFGRLSTSSQGMTNEERAKAAPGARPFEMPDGWNQIFQVERFKVIEGMFDHEGAYTDAENRAPKLEHTIPNLIIASLNSVDVDTRPALLANVVLVGGSTLITHLHERVKRELEAAYPNVRVRLHAPGNPVERKFASWIGGSILASLGTFHQMWISRKEYEEHGAGLVEKRCK